MNLFDFLILAMAVATASVTLSLADITQPLREWVAKLGPKANKLAHCPYCQMHWLALGGVLYYQPPTFMDGVLYTLACVTVASLFTAGLVRLFLLLEDLEAGEE